MALIDAGRIGQAHAKSFVSFPDVEVVVVYNLMIAAAEGVRPLVRAGSVTDLAKEALERPGIKAVVICTPPGYPSDFHRGGCSRAKRAIFCEKPVALGLLERRAPSERPMLPGLQVIRISRG